MNGVQKKKLISILNDKTSGSSDLLAEVNKLLLETLPNLKTVEEIIGRIKRSFSHFTIIENYIKELNRILDKKDLNLLEIFLKKYSGENDNYKNIAAKLKRRIHNFKRIVTISRSKTFSDVISLADPKKKIEITVLESRPENEGRLTAGELLRNGFNVKFVTDAMMAFAVQKSDAVVIGADSILRNKNVINKSGSLALAVICKFYKKPFYVLAAKSKYSNRKSFKPFKEKGNAVWNYSNKKLEILNYPFEEIDFSLITEIISD